MKRILLAASLVSASAMPVLAADFCGSLGQVIDARSQFFDPIAGRRAGGLPNGHTLYAAKVSIPGAKICHILETAHFGGFHGSSGPLSSDRSYICSWSKEPAGAAEKRLTEMIDRVDGCVARLPSGRTASPKRLDPAGATWIVGSSERGAAVRIERSGPRDYPTASLTVRVD